MTNINLLYAIWFVYKFTLFIVIIFDIYILIGKHMLISFPKAWDKFDSPEIKLTSSKTIFNKALK
jgi:hypothetical protein